MTAHGHQLFAVDLRQCPDEQLLVQFANLDLPEDRNQSVQQHVTACLQCQSTLDRITGSSGLSHCISGTPRILDETVVKRIVDELCDEVAAFGQGSNDAADLPSPITPIENLASELDNYRLFREIASGASATVYEALDTQTNLPVAIKFIRKSDPNAVQRAQREARALSKIRHPSIVSLQAIETTSNGRVFLVMPLVSGSPLSALIHGNQPPTAQESVNIVRQVCQGLIEVHRQGLLHRDIKPSNIMVESTGVARLTDFGLATFIDEESSLTESGAIVGTPCYMSPEQASGLPSVDARSDLYALGVTLYECLTETKPFRGSAAEVIRQVLTTEPVPPSSIKTQLPRELDVICQKAMAKEPDRRFSNAEDMCAELDRWLQSKPIVSRGLTRIGRLQLWGRRNPVLAASILGLFLSVTSGIVGALINWRNAIVQRDTARQNMLDSVRSVDRFYAELSRSPTFAAPGKQPLKLELLKLAAKSYEDFLKTWPDDLFLQGEMVTALSRVAEITESIGTLDESIVAWRRAAAVAAKMASDHPSDSHWRYQHWMCRFHEANALVQAKKIDEALPVFADGKRSILQLIQLEPNNSKYKRDLAACAGSLGNCEFHLNHPEEAGKHYRDAADQFERLLIQEPTHRDINQKLATALTNLAMTLPAEKQVSILQKARIALQNISQPTPTVLRRIAKLELQEGIALRFLDQPEQALVRWKTGIAQLEPVVVANPDVHDYRWLLAQLYYECGRGTSSLEDSLDFLVKAKENQQLLQQKDPTPPDRNRELLRSLVCLAVRYQKVQRLDEFNGLRDTICKNPALMELIRLDGESPNLIDERYAPQIAELFQSLQR
jgi:serine/threonine protein kinase